MRNEEFFTGLPGQHVNAKKNLNYMDRKSGKWGPGKIYLRRRSVSPHSQVFDVVGKMQRTFPLVAATCNMGQNSPLPFNMMNDISGVRNRHNPFRVKWDIVEF